MEKGEEKASITKAEGDAAMADEALAKAEKEKQVKLEGKSMAEEVAGDCITKIPKIEAGAAVVAEAGWNKGAASTTKQAGGAGKKTKLLRYDKEIIEFKLRQGRPSPFPYVPRPCAAEVELAIYAQKSIDRYEQMCKQYVEKGYAEIEVTDDEDEGEIDEAKWRPFCMPEWAQREIDAMLGTSST